VCGTVRHVVAKRKDCARYRVLDRRRIGPCDNFRPQLSAGDAVYTLVETHAGTWLSWVQPMKMTKCSGVGTERHTPRLASQVDLVGVG
jgi:hypothetical protein